MRCKFCKSDGWCRDCLQKKRGGPKRSSPPIMRSSEAYTTELEIIMAMSRPKDNPKEKAGSKVADDVLNGWLPSLHEFLTEIQWEDGKSRKTGTVMILCEDGLWKAWIHDRDNQVSGWWSGESWEGLLEGVNKALGTQTLSWRKDRR